MPDNVKHVFPFAVPFPHPDPTSSKNSFHILIYGSLMLLYLGFFSFVSPPPSYLGYIFYISVSRTHNMWDIYLYMM